MDWAKLFGFLRERAVPVAVLLTFGTACLVVGAVAEDYPRELLLAFGAPLVLAAPLVVVERYLNDAFETKVQDAVVETAAATMADQHWANLEGLTDEVEQLASKAGLSFTRLPTEDPVSILWAPAGSSKPLVAALITPLPISATQAAHYEKRGVRLLLTPTGWTKAAAAQCPGLVYVKLTGDYTEDLAKKFKDLAPESA